MDVNILKLLIESGGLGALSIFVMYSMFKRFMGYIENHADHVAKVVEDNARVCSALLEYLRQLNGDNVEQMCQDRRDVSSALQGGGA